MKLITNFVRKLAQKFKCFALTQCLWVRSKYLWLCAKKNSFKNCVKFWFNNLYLFLFELLTLKVVLLASKLVRKYLILKGKDPDYVAPPPPEPTVDDVWSKHSTRHKNPFVNLGVKNEWVTNPSTHPVLKLRGSFVPPDKPAYTPVVEQNEPLQVVTLSLEETLKLFNDMADEADKKEE